MIRARFSELELADLGDEIWEEIYPRAESAVDRGVEVILREARSLLSRRRGRKSTAAPAGEPPEYDTGELSRSLKPGRLSKTKYSVRRFYGSDHRAARLHEYGGRLTHQDGSIRNYPPRPYLRPAEIAVEDEINDILEAL